MARRDRHAPGGGNRPEGAQPCRNVVDAARGILCALLTSAALVLLPAGPAEAQESPAEGMSPSLPGEELDKVPVADQLGDQRGDHRGHQLGERHYRVRETGLEITIDGRLEEAAWAEAVPIELPYETRPAENTPAPVQTEVLLLHDRSHLYAAFKAYDPEPEKIRARLTDRDTAFQDDFVGIVLDTFNDERRAFEFFINPRGVQMDMFNDDLSGNEDESWDALWDSAGRVTDEGYVVEIAIPFSSLSFPGGQGELTWGIDLIRYWPREQRRRLASQPLDREISCYLCQISKITGFAGITPGKNLEIVPTLTGGRTDSRESLSDPELTSGDFDSEVGATVRWGVTPNLTLSGTLNPDFSQVEADAAQLDINEQFTLFFPEKRPFFLDGADFFNTQLNTVFTRNVADPSWGGKLTGKVGGNAVGVFAAQDEVTNLVIPGIEGSETVSLDMETTDAVLRYRRDLGESSSIGVLYTGREGSGYENRVGGIDGLWRITESDRLAFQALSSRTQYPGAVAADFGQPTGAFDDWAGTLSYNHRSRNWRAWGSYTDIGEDFRADMGFIPQVGFSRVVGGMGYAWYGDDDDRWTSIYWGGDWDLTEDSRGKLLEREIESSFEIDGPYQSELDVWGGRRDRVFQGVEFDETFWGSWMAIRPSGKVWAGLYVRGGDQIDFANVRPGKTLVLDPQVSLNLGLRTRLVLQHTHQELDVEEGRLFTADLSQMRLVYQLNLRTFLRAIVQYTTVERDPDLYQDEVDAMSERLFAQLLFSYKLNPRTVLFLGYSDASRSDDQIPLTAEDRSVFLKIGYAWVL